MKFPDFNERAVLILAVVGLLAAQTGIVGYQALTCKTSENICIKKNESLATSGDSAAKVLLALLVPAVSVNLRKSSKSKEEDRDS
jgi:hypothetical protein